MKRYYDTKIGKIIDEEFDSRMESVLFFYILEKGIESIKQINEDNIKKLEGK